MGRGWIPDHFLNDILRTAPWFIMLPSLTSSDVRPEEAILPNASIRWSRCDTWEGWAIHARKRFLWNDKKMVDSELSGWWSILSLSCVWDLIVDSISQSSLSASISALNVASDCSSSHSSIIRSINTSCSRESTIGVFRLIRSWDMNGL